MNNLASKSSSFAYQCRYVPQCIPGPDVRERRGICCRNIPRGVGTTSGEFHRYVPIFPVTHCAQQGDSYWVFVRDYVGG